MRVWRMYMAPRTYIWNVHEVEVVVTISVSVVFFVYIYMVCLCGGAQGQEGFLRTKHRRTPDQMYIYILYQVSCIFECSRSRTEV